jgi:putative addiction module component (TIGR02574 family)
MTETAAQLKNMLSQLSANDRAELARFLIESLDEGMDDDAEAAWEAELARRLTEIESGSARGEAVETVFAELRKKYS